MPLWISDGACAGTWGFVMMGHALCAMRHGWGAGEEISTSVLGGERCLFITHLYGDVLGERFHIVGLKICEHSRL